MFRTLTLLSASGLLVVAASGCRKRTHNEGAAVKDAWNAENDPQNFGSEVERRYDILPRKSQLSRQPWADTYWPNSMGGVAVRWQRTSPGSTWSNKLYTKSELKNLSEDDLRTLSPAEKYDIYMGRYDYPLVKRERSRTHPTDLGWTGICHGWAVAALQWEEPKPVTVTNRDGIEIPFGSSDIKALISVGHDMLLAFPKYSRVGLRSDSTTGPQGTGSQTADNDTNAGAFHVVLTNFIKPGKTGVVMDVFTEDQVWNHPIYSYSVREVKRTRGHSSNAAPGTVEEVTLSTKVTYATETAPQWNPHVSAGTNTLAEATYDYTLELNANGYIIGGEWNNKSRPDFMWVSAVPDFNATVSDVNLAGVLTLYKESMRGTRPAVTPMPDSENNDDPDNGGDVQPPRPTNTNCPTISSFGKCFQAWPTCQWLHDKNRCVARPQQ